MRRLPYRLNPRRTSNVLGWRTTQITRDRFEGAAFMFVIFVLPFLPIGGA